MLGKEELLETIRNCAECLEVEGITEDVLEQAMLNWSYNPFKSCFVFQTEEGLLCIPTKFLVAMGECLELDKAYIASTDEIQSALQLLKQCYEELLCFVRGDF